MKIYTLLLVLCLSTISANKLFDSNISNDVNLNGQGTSITDNADGTNILDTKTDIYGVKYKYRRSDGKLLFIEYPEDQILREKPFIKSNYYKNIELRNLHRSKVPQ